VSDKVTSDAATTSGKTAEHPEEGKKIRVAIVGVGKTARPA